MKLIDKDALVSEINKLKSKVSDESSYCNGWQHALRMLEIELNTFEVKELQEESVSGDLIDATNNYCVNVRKGYPRVMDETDRYICNAFKAGAKWQKQKLWKQADGDDLPEIDREVIALTQPYPLEGNEYAVSFAHRPNPDGWDGKSVVTGNIEHYTPKTYNNGGWNIPNVKYWLDCLMPKEIEL